jgi:hypothetical protein
MQNNNQCLFVCLFALFMGVVWFYTAHTILNNQTGSEWRRAATWSSPNWRPATRDDTFVWPRTRSASARPRPSCWQSTVREILRASALSAQLLPLHYGSTLPVWDVCLGRRLSHLWWKITKPTAPSILPKKDNNTHRQTDGVISFHRQMCVGGNLFVGRVNWGRHYFKKKILRLAVGLYLFFWEPTPPCLGSKDKNFEVQRQTHDNTPHILLGGFFQSENKPTLSR